MELLATVELYGEKLVPWSTPRSFQGGKPGGKRLWIHAKNKKLCAWQDAIRQAHRKVYGREPYRGPVMLVTTFFRGTKDQALWGQKWWSEKSSHVAPDRVNLEKGAEDALTTYRQWKGKGEDKRLVLEIPGVFENDSQTCDGFTRKRWGPQDGIEIKIYSLGDEPDDHDHDRRNVRGVPGDQGRLTRTRGKTHGEAR